MDRRQLLLGATALGLKRNLSLSALASPQGASPPTTGDVRLSDRERAGLRGPVRTSVDFNGDEAESMCEEEYAEDGRLLVWRGRISGGSRGERVYSYNEAGRLIGITGDGANGTNELRFDEHGRRIMVRTVPPRPDRRNVGFGSSIIFEATEAGDNLIGGGTVTTRYNEYDHPIESLVRDGHGDLLTRIVHNYDANGRLSDDTLLRESIEVPDYMIPEQVGEQLSPEDRQIMRAQIKQGMNELMRKHEALRSAERSYLYDGEGRLAVGCIMRMGSFVQEKSTTRNDHGDEASEITVQTGSAFPDTPPHDDRFEVRYTYNYDGHGNWTERTTILTDGSAYPTRRKLTYY
jgi:hypothetical protein